MRARHVGPVFLLVHGLAAGAAAADRPIIVPADDTRSQAQLARRLVALSAWVTRLEGPGDSATATWVQVGVGPLRWQLPFRGATLGPLHRWSARGRFGFVTNDGGEVTAAPLTLAAQRLSVLDTLAITPLLHLQSGIELAFSTPWLSDRRSVPGPAMQLLHGADAELAGNGWSLRPATWHFRLDLPMCRSFYLEAGVGPELFRSTASESTEVDLSWRAALGISLGCTHRASALLNHLTVVAQYRARGVLYDSRPEVSPSYHDTLSFAVQYDWDRIALAAFGAVEAGAAVDDARLIGLRLQLGIGESDR